MKIIVFGMPRSGTSWCGKMFDAHPDIAYLHEPEIAIASGLPVFADPGTETVARASEDLARWLEARDARTCGTRPVLRKRGETALHYRLRAGQIYAAKALERLRPSRRPLGGVLPPFAGRPPHTVLKTINLLGRAELLMQAAPEMRAIQLLRHPGGYIASVLRGIAKFGEAHARSALSYGAMVDSPLGREEGLTLDRLEAMAPVERLAWKWLVFNDAAFRSLSGSERALVVRYEDIARDPVGRMQSIFADLGIAWDPAVESFIRRSTGGGSGSYYEVRRDPEQAAQRWRNDLADADFNVIRKICERADVGRLAMREIA